MAPGCWQVADSVQRVYRSPNQVPPTDHGGMPLCRFSSYILRSCASGLRQLAIQPARSGLIAPPRTAQLRTACQAYTGQQGYPAQRDTYRDPQSPMSGRREVMTCILRSPADVVKRPSCASRCISAGSETSMLIMQQALTLCCDLFEFRCCPRLHC